MEKNTGFKYFTAFTILATTLFIVGNFRAVSGAALVQSRFQRSLRNETFPPCTLQEFSMNGTLENIANDFIGNYTTILTMNVSVVGDAVTNYSSTDVINPFFWYWSLGGRGKVLLKFPYNYIPLSFNTLQPGVRHVNVSFRATQDFVNMELSEKETCMFQSLVYLSNRVRIIVEEAGGVLPNEDDDLICREKMLSSPSPSITKMPGYSLFELQASSYYFCYSQITMNVSELITVITVVIYLVLFLAVAYKFWRILTSRARAGEDDEDEIDATDTSINRNKDTGDEDYINILRISIIPPVLVVLALNDRKHQKLFHLLYWGFIFLLPLLLYIIAVICHAILVGEYNHRRMLLGNAFLIREILCDHILANVLYLVGVSLFLYYIYKYDIDPIRGDERRLTPYGKRKKVAFYTLVAVCCFFRFSASLLLVAEIISMVLVGISINFNYLYPAWLNVVVGLIALVVYIVKFFDSYQVLFNSIYSVGNKVDKEGLPHRIFRRQTDDSGDVPQTQFEIKASLLSDIIRKRLPLHLHLFRTFMHIVIALGIIAIIAVIVIYIDAETDTSKFVEYLLTVGSLLLAGSTRLNSNPCLSSGKLKNRNQHRLYTLEEGLREYAQTGRFPPPSRSCWVTYFKRSWCPPWCCTYCQYDKEKMDYREVPTATSASPDADPTTPASPASTTAPTTVADTVVSVTPTGTVTTTTATGTVPSRPNAEAPPEVSMKNDNKTEEVSSV